MLNKHGEKMFSFLLFNFLNKYVFFKSFMASAKNFCRWLFFPGSMAVSHFTKIKILSEFNEPTFNFILLSNDFDELDGGGARHFQASF